MQKTNNNKSELISIVIPVYNLEGYIAKCIDSIVNQSYKNIEIIIIDDGSTDKSPEIIKIYENKDRRIQYYFQDNKGPGSARNIGIKKAQGSWITFVDGDDTVSPKFIEKLYFATTKHNCDMALCNFIMENDKPNNEKPIVKILNSKDEIAEIMLKDMWKYKICTFMSFGKLMKTEIIKRNNIKFPENINNAEDLIFSIDYWSEISSGIYLKECLYTHSPRKNSLSRSKIKVRDVIQGRKIFDKKILDYFYKSNLIEKFPQVKRLKFQSKKIILVDCLRKLRLIH